MKDLADVADQSAITWLEIARGHREAGEYRLAIAAADVANRLRYYALAAKSLSSNKAQPEANPVRQDGHGR